MGIFMDFCRVRFFSGYIIHSKEKYSNGNEKQGICKHTGFDQHSKIAKAVKSDME